MKLTSAAAALALCASTSVFAGTTTLDFETVTSFASIAQYYNGGADSAGNVGPALGVSFGGDALGLVNDFDTYFTHAPSPIGVMAPVGLDATMNVASGFAGNFSFFYSSASAVANGVQVWSGLNGSGSLLASFNLLANATNGCSDSAFCHFDSSVAGFSGTARSVTFGNAAGAAFDNVSLNVNVTPVPEPSTLVLMSLGLAGLIAAGRRRP